MLGYLQNVGNRLRQVRQRHGLPAMLRLLVDRVAKRLIGLEVSEMFWLNKSDVPHSEGTDLNLSYGFLTQDEIEHYQADQRNSLAPEFVVRARDHHDLCFAARIEDRLANFAWYALHGIEGGRCAPITLTTPAQVAYMYNAYTHPDFRGQRLHGLTTELALEELSDLGIESLVLFVDWTNEASLRSYRRLGGRRIGKLVSVGWGKFKWTFAPCAASKLGIRFGRGARPGKVFDCSSQELVTH